MKYRLTKVFSQTHALAVTHVAFSPDGHYLATSDLAGTLCLWDTLAAKLLHHYSPGTSILSLVWMDSTAIACGLGDGMIVRIRLEKDVVEVSGSWCHSYAIEHLAMGKGRLASGAHRDIYIWEIRFDVSTEQLPSLELEIELPAMSDDEDDEELLVTGLHWTPDGNHLITTFMTQGIYVFESRSWTVVRRIGENTVGASSCLTPDGRRIAASNLVYGLDIYDIQSGSLSATIPQNVVKEYPPPIVYIHEGHAIASG
ncbi:WD40 repeat-like protein, partial [Cubamyces sp. BRFM 1775]